MSDINVANRHLAASLTALFQDVDTGVLVRLRSML